LDFYYDFNKKDSGGTVKPVYQIWGSTLEDNIGCRTKNTLFGITNIHINSGRKKYLNQVQNVVKKVASV